MCAAYLLRVILSERSESKDPYLAEQSAAPPLAAGERILRLPPAGVDQNDMEIRYSNKKPVLGDPRASKKPRYHLASQKTCLKTR